MSNPVDRFGNDIVRGRLLYWGKIDTPVKVVDVIPGGEPAPGSTMGELTPGALIVQLLLPFGNSSTQALACFKDFMCILDPEESARVDKIAKAAGG